MRIYLDPLGSIWLHLLDGCAKSDIQKEVMTVVPRLACCVGAMNHVNQAGLF